MQKTDFKFVKGTLSPGQPADIYFYTEVDYWSVQDFLNEFDWITNYVYPSEIRIHINSVGGSVTDGMSVFSRIIDCEIPTVTINDALAASMGSIIWAAGCKRKMKDYALLMIHNPFCDSCPNPDENTKQVLEAFTSQLKTIYMKRFGLSAEQVEEIMNGKEGCDGTFMTAEQAIEKGFVSAEEILETPKAIREQIAASIKDVSDLSKLSAIMGLVAAIPTAKTINKQNTKPINKKMEDSNLNVVAALLGLSGAKATSENVTAKIDELKAKADKADELQKNLDKANEDLNTVNAQVAKIEEELTTTKAELTGSQTTVNNLKADLEQVNSELQVYKDAEAKAKEDKINALIDQAEADGKISKEERDLYLSMAQNNYELAENVISKIPGRPDLSKKIAGASQPDASERLKDTEKEIQDKVNEVVGKNFAFRTLS